MLDKEYNGIVEFEVGGCHCSQLGVIDGEDSNSRAAIHKMWAVGDPFEGESMHSILYWGGGEVAVSCGPIYNTLTATLSSAE